MALRSDLQEQFQKTISTFSKPAWAALQPGTKDPNDVEIIVQPDACEAVAAADTGNIAQDAPLHNARVAWRDRLPNELWNSVLELLPFTDCVSATHVCADWRASMYALPRVWTSVHLYTYNAQPGLTRTPGAIPDLLALSKHFPLDVTVEESNRPSRSVFDVLLAIAKCLKVHAPRISRLCVRSPHVDTPKRLLEQFTVLPTLREFVADRSAVLRFERSSVSSFWPWPRRVELPVLERVQLGRDFTWPRNGCCLPRVRILHLTTSEDATEDLRAALASCPELTTLTVDLHWASDDDPDSCLYTFLNNDDLPKGLQSVTALSVRSKDGLWPAYCFRKRDLRELVIQYDDCEKDPNYRCYTFGDLVRWCPVDWVDVRMTYSTNERLSIRAVANDGRMRQTSCNMCQDPTPDVKWILEDLSRTTVKVVADASLRDSLSGLAFNSVEIEFCSGEAGLS